MFDAISAEAQSAYARHGPSALTSHAPNPVSTAFDNLIRELGATCTRGHMGAGNGNLSTNVCRHFRVGL
jgi:hypothetical protein